MAVPRKLVAVPNSATRELWRIAETGEMDQLEAVLPRADINARNEHGMTALMRAAYHGRVQMVRVLLEYGADPNVARNDNFTALSLAAFFGHAEIVEMLLSHGAKTDVATRFGTSPQVWARARSFGDVARSLEKRNHEFKKSALERSVVEKPVVEKSVLERSMVETPVLEKSVVQEPGPPLVVRTLKEPPEIWDLVHEAPRNFNARSAFMARMGSLNAVLASVVGLLILIGAGVGGAFYLKQRVPSASSTASPAPATATVTTPVVNQPAETTNIVPEANIVTEAPPPIATEPPPSVVTSNAPARRSRSFARPLTLSSEPTDETNASVETAAAPPAIPPAKPEPRSSVEADTKKSSAPTNSQMITVPKSPQPKAKVIQWP